MTVPLKNFISGQTNLIFRFADETWKKSVPGGRNKNKNTVNFYNRNSNFESFFSGFCDDTLACLP